MATPKTPVPASCATGSQMKIKALWSFSETLNASPRNRVELPVSRTEPSRTSRRAGAHRASKLRPSIAAYGASTHGSMRCLWLVTPLACNSDALKRGSQSARRGASPT